MFKAQHLESLSQLAAGIAHDFNNLLGGIFGYIDIAREYSQTPEKSVEYIDKAIRSLDRAKDLSMRLLTFSRGGAPVKKLSSISELVSDAVSLSLAGKNVKAELRISPDIMQCDVDPMQMGRVFHNLIVNAQQSMPGGGVLYIAAVNTDVPEGSGLPLTPGRYVSICFKDQGPGIPEDIRKKIFDPFFTTKKQGSGLGLAICQSVLARHGGHIEVECPAGGGTEFTLYLPASGKPAISNVPAVFSTLSGSGKILVMDDEEYVLDFASQMLRQLGYTPVISQHSEETANKYRNALESGSPFRAVILDLTIPGDEGGVETVRRLSAIDPEVIAVASSGYSSDPVMAEPEKFGFKAVLKKPYMKKDLGRTLAALLNK
jgi:CheY-like chemotaxis protein/two-component sensor histidine kinase